MEPQSMGSYLSRISLHSQGINDSIYHPPPKLPDFWIMNTAHFSYFHFLVFVCFNGEIISIISHSRSRMGVEVVKRRFFLMDACGIPSIFVVLQSALAISIWGTKVANVRLNAIRHGFWYIWMPTLEDCTAECDNVKCIHAHNDVHSMSRGWRKNFPK